MAEEPRSMTRRPRWLSRRGAPEPASGQADHGADADALPVLELTNPILPGNAGRHPQSPVSDDDTVPYLMHFGLQRAPFSLLPDPDFLFWSTSHKRAHAMLEYGLMNRSPLTLITGEIGAGKTTLVHQILRGPGADRRVGLISNASDLRGELLYWALMALGERPERGADPAVLFEAFQTCLIDTYAAGRRVVLIFDEAQTLGRDRLEALRMLTNINAGTDVLLQIVLVGQPELREVIRAPDMVQFAQRVAANFHLPAMDADTETLYINHRLAVAGAGRSIFDDDALTLVHHVTGGVPRLTNQICDLAMLYAYSADKLSVDPACVQHVLDEDLLLGARPERQDGADLARRDMAATGPA